MIAIFKLPIFLYGVLIIFILNVSGNCAGIDEIPLDNNNIQISNTLILENQPIGTFIGLLSPVNSEFNTSYSYGFFRGNLNPDNFFFTISGDSLFSAFSFDYESDSIFNIRIIAGNNRGDAFQTTFSIQIENINTALALSYSLITENAPIGTLIGTFTTIDPDNSGPHSYTLVAGNGDADNELFTIAKDSLLLDGAVDYESNSSLEIRVQTKDNQGSTLTMSFVIQVNNINDAPTALFLSSSQIAEDAPVGTLVGTFITTDPDISDTHSYTLVPGSGDKHNNLFVISDDSLFFDSAIDYESDSSLEIRVQTNDGNGGTFQMAITFSVSSINDAPTALTLSTSQIEENIPIGTPVGTFTTTDIDNSGTHSYTLVPGNGDTDNALFTTSGNSLLSNGVIDYESDSILEIRVQTNDGNGGTFQMAFVIKVNDGDDPPTIISSTFSVSESAEIGDVVGQIFVTDDVGIASYSLVSGNTGNAFALSNDGLITVSSLLDYETLTNYTLHIEVTDVGGNNIKGNISISIKNVIQLTYIDVIIDTETLNLQSVTSMTTAVISGAIYLFTAATHDDGIGVFSVSAGGVLNQVDAVNDNGTLYLDGVRGLTTAVISGTTYLFATGATDDGVSVFSVSDGGILNNVDNVGNNNTLHLEKPNLVTTTKYFGATYLFVGGSDNHQGSNGNQGISVFSVSDAGVLTNVNNVADNSILKLNTIFGMTTATFGLLNYLFIGAGHPDDGISVFSILPDSTLTNVDNVSDNSTLRLNGLSNLKIASISGTTYLFALGFSDDGISVFSVSPLGILTSVYNFFDPNVNLHKPRGLEVVPMGGTTFLFATGSIDDGLVGFSVSSDGSLTTLINISDDETLTLDGASVIESVTVNGETYLYVSGYNDDGITIFRITDL